jgi:hypothetical protein
MSNRKEEEQEDVDIATRLRQLTERLRSVRTELARSLRDSPMPLAPPRERPLPEKDPSEDS